MNIHTMVVSLTCQGSKKYFNLNKTDNIMTFQKLSNGEYNSDCPNIGKIANKVKHTYNENKKRGFRVSFVGCNKNEIEKGKKFRIAVEFRIEEDMVREYNYNKIYKA